MYPPEMVAFAVGVQMRTPGSDGALQPANADTQLADNKMSNAENRRFMGPHGIQEFASAFSLPSALRMPAMFSVAADYLDS